MTEQATMTNEELSLLIDWMADQPFYTKADLADAVTKPHKWLVELAAAKHEQETEDHGMHCVHVNYEAGKPVTADCDDCNWTAGDKA